MIIQAPAVIAAAAARSAVRLVFCHISFWVSLSIGLLCLYWRRYACGDTIDAILRPFHRQTMDIPLPISLTPPGLPSPRHQTGDRTSQAHRATRMHREVPAIGAAPLSGRTKPYILVT